MADLAHRAELEDRVTREMGRLSARQRRRLTELLGDPPDPANVPESFWAEVEEERRRELAALLLLIFLVGARQHGADDKGAAAAAASQYAERRSAELARKYVEHSRETLDRHGSEWRQRGATVIDDSQPGGDATGNVASQPGKREAREASADVFAPSRDESIGITETTAAGGAGGEWAVDQAGGTSDGDLWVTEKDARVCPICSPLHRKPRTTWGDKFPLGPPGHPRCRCWIEYANVPGRPVPAGVA